MNRPTDSRTKVEKSINVFFSKKLSISWASFSGNRTVRVTEAIKYLVLNCDAYNTSHYAAQLRLTRESSDFIGLSLSHGGLRLKLGVLVIFL